MEAVKKTLRFTQIYGSRRTVIKVAGRSRSSSLNFFFPEIFLSKKKKSISLIGCGQFGFSTISYFLLKEQGNRFLECYDVNKKNQESTARFWKYGEQDSVEALIDNPSCQLIYIASNHSSHSAYAVKALGKDKSVYIEKPIAVNYGQLKELLYAGKESKGQVFVGYNRPFSRAVSLLRKNLKDDLPITLNCFVVGHKIGKDHWYRNPEEGTRVCGNMGHWIDLAVHLMASRSLVPDSFEISISYTSELERDDNLAVTVSTSLGDLVTIILSAREEPFEGINETINLQQGEVIAKIDDFRKMSLWKGSEYKKYSFKPKDVGHLKAINQPFQKETRNFNEIITSTVLMLEITAMVVKGERQRTVRPEEIKDKLLQDL